MKVSEVALSGMNDGFADGKMRLDGHLGGQRIAGVRHAPEQLIDVAAPDKFRLRVDGRWRRSEHRRVRSVRAQSTHVSIS